MRECSIDECERVPHARGMCRKHYNAWYRAENAEKIRESKAQYCAENAEKVRERKARWNAENREKRREYQALWRAENPESPEERRERDARYYAENAEKVRESQARYRAENPEKVRAAWSRRRARKAGATVEDFTREEIFERDGWVCGLCDEPIDQSLSYPDLMSASLDHVIPLARGGEHSRANAQAAHLRCNLQKGARVAA